MSQSVREGTVSPTSYNVIEDQVALSTDKLQRFTYMLCHMYFNWSVSFFQCLVSSNVLVLAFDALQFEESCLNLSSGDRQSACTMPVCSQAGLLGGPGTPSGATC